MPTPVGTARQCLTREAEQALEEAVAVARRRGHAQTTSLHLVSSLLSLPSSTLREACSRTRNNAYSTRIQFKALDLCLGVSLDRLPSSNNRVEEPPISNSLMAAIKRSQANQRRQPENIHFYQHLHQQQQQQQQFLSSPSSSSVSVVKVELQNLILSILDDPVVSRVFGESGFRSSEIKLAILRPVHHQLFRYSRYKGPPIFLCNLNGDSELRRRGLSFSYTGFPEVLDGEENCRRIGEILSRGDGRRNPLLVGMCCYNALSSFLEMVQRRRGRTVLPVELSGLGVVCIENEVLKFVSGNCEEELLKLRFQEIDKMIENSIGPGVLVNFGDLKAMASDDDASSFDAFRFVVSELARLLEIHGRKVWLIGAAARYETYLKFLNIFPSVEKDLELQLLPITTMRFSIAESYPRSSLMDSFVPFGGFFSTPSEAKGSFSGLDQSACQLCDEKCDEVNILSNRRCPASIPSHHQSSSSWLNSTPFTAPNSCFNIMKAKDDTALLSTKFAGLQTERDDSCQHLHQSQTPMKVTSGHLGSQITSIVGFQVFEDGKTNVNNDSRSPASTSSTPSDKDVGSFMSRDSQHFSTTKVSSPTSLLSKGSNMNLLSKIPESEIPPKVLEDQGVCSPFSSTSSSARNGFTSPTSVISRTIDLNLGINSYPTSRELHKPTNNGCIGLVQNSSSCFSANPDIISRNKPFNTSKSSSCSQPDIHDQVDEQDFEMLYGALAKRIGRQEEAVQVISHTIAHCRTTNERRQGVNRGDIWFNFLGPDRLAKKELAIALAEFHGSRENLIHVNLDFQDEIIRSNDIFDVQVQSDYDSIYRGKNLVDYIAEKLCKRPFSVVLLENVDKADLLVQSSLSKAVKTGRFSDSHGREFGIGNAIFVTTSTFRGGEKIMHPGAVDYSEEDVLTVKGLPIQMMIGFDLGDYATNQNTSTLDIQSKGSCKRIFMNKRKLIGHADASEEPCGNLEMAKRAHKASDASLDLNFPAVEGESCKACSANSECVWSDCSRTWLEDFLGEVDAIVTLKPCDFDSIAQQILKDVSDCFQKTVRFECSLEIDSRVMIQMVAAAFLTDKNRVEEWVQSVLSNGFEKVQEKYSLNSRSTVKLVVREENVAEDQRSSELLPSRIIVY